MNDKTNYQNNPLHGVSLNKMLTTLVGHYGFDILYAYLNINCFKTNASIESSEKFLKKTQWAREKVEGFYLYEYKSLPRATAKEFELSPRDRTIPLDQVPGEPKALSLEDAQKLREKRAKKAAESGGIGYRHGKRFTYGQKAYEKKGGEKKHDRKTAKSAKPYSEAYSQSSDKSDKKPNSGSSDPWAKWKKD